MPAAAVPSANFTRRPADPRPAERGRAGAGLLTGARPLASEANALVVVITIVRWGTLLVGAALAASLPDTRTARVAIGIASLTVYTAVRTVWPLHRSTAEPLNVLQFALDLALPTALVAVSGYWSSPLLFSLVPAAMATGLGYGGPVGAAASALVGGLVTAADVLSDPGQALAESVRGAAQWTAALAMVSVLAGYGQRMLSKAVTEKSRVLDHVSNLTEANTLLHTLHQLTQSLPASLDLDDVLGTTLENVRSLCDAEVIAILLVDPSTGMWLSSRVVGTRLPDAIAEQDLPEVARLAFRARVVMSLDDLVQPSIPAITTAVGPAAADTTEAATIDLSQARPAPAPTVLADTGGFAAATRSGIYVPLLARAQLIGLLAVEHGEERHYDARIVDLLSRLAEPAALALDNARWFSRIRKVTADEERNRIARDLHDRIGQTLAYLGFELDRVAKQAHHVQGEASEKLARELDRLRDEVRNVVSEVRETLYDLRTDVRESANLVSTLDSFLQRVRSRTSLDVRFEHEGDISLPARHERELWRIAQEAITNVERHAGAHRLVVRWLHRDGQAVLEIEDDGKGFIAGAGRTDSYGMLGLRERASAIGARLEIDSSAGEGTTVRCRLYPPAPEGGGPVAALSGSRL